MTHVCLSSLHEDLAYIVELESIIRDKERCSWQMRKNAKDELVSFRLKFLYSEEEYSYEKCLKILGETEC